MKKTRILISGGAGFIGFNTAKLALKNDYQVRILDNLSKPVHLGDKKWPKHIPNEIEKIYGDVRKIKDWEKALTNIDYVIHLAAYQDLLPNLGRFFDTNTHGTGVLYEAIIKNKFPVKKVVVASSQFVYGEGKYFCSKHGEILAPPRKLEDLEKGGWEVKCPKCSSLMKPLLGSEDHQDPRNQYSISKYSQELIALRLGKLFNIPSVAMRYSIVQGPYQSYRNAYSGVLRIFTMQLMADQQPTIYEDGRQLRDYVNVEDVARANLLVLENKKADGENFNVGGGKGYTVLEFANIAREVLGKEKIKPLITSKFRLGDTRHSVSDISKIKKLGWKPTKTPDYSIKTYSDWLKKEKIDKDYLKEAEENLIKSGALRSAKGSRK